MKKKYIILAVLFLILICIITNKTFSQNNNDLYILSETKIAKPILEIEGDEKIAKQYVSENNKVNDYNFKIKNYNQSGKINEVALNYSILIEEDNKDLNVEYKLYKVVNQIEEEIILNNNKSDILSLAIDKKEEQNYRLKVIANSTTDLNNTNLGVKLKIDVIQKGGN